MDWHLPGALHCSGVPISFVAEVKMTRGGGVALSLSLLDLSILVGRGDSDTVVRVDLVDSGEWAEIKCFLFVQVGG